MVAAAGTTWHVDAQSGSTDPGCGTATEPCRSIGAAIDRADDGDLVAVAAGTYAEQVVIDKAITVSGAGAGASVLTAENASITATTPRLLNIDGAGVSGDIVFEGFTVRDAGPANIKPDGQAIYAQVSAADGGSSTIRNSEFLLGDSSDPNMEGPVGIYTRPGGPVIIENNVLEGFWQAVLAERSGDVTVRGNKFRDLRPVESLDYEPLGVYILRYQSGPSPQFVISDNTFTDFAGVAIAMSAGYPGKEADCVDGCHIAATVHGNDYALDASSSDRWKSTALSTSARDADNVIAVDFAGNHGYVAGTASPIEFRDGPGTIKTSNSTGDPNEIGLAPADGDPGSSPVMIEPDMPHTIVGGGEPIEFEMLAANDLDEALEDARFDITIHGPAPLSAGDVTLRHGIENPSLPDFAPMSTAGGTVSPAAADDYVDVPLTPTPGGGLAGFFPEQFGFPLEPGDHPVPLMIELADGAPAGGYSVEFSIVQVDDDGSPFNTFATSSAGFELAADPTDIAVTKTVDAAVDHRHEWDLDLTSDLAEVRLGDEGGSADIDHRVTATPGDRIDEIHRLGGEISITNGSDGAVVVEVTEETDVGDDWTCEVIDGDLGPVGSLALEADETATLLFTCDGEEVPTDGSTTTVVSWADGEAEVTTEEPAVFTPAESLFEQVTILEDPTDADADPVTLGEADWNEDGTATVFEFTRTVEGLAVDECTVVDTTVRIAETEQTRSAEVEICPAHGTPPDGPDGVGDGGSGGGGGGSILPITGSDLNNIARIAGLSVISGAAFVALRRRLGRPV